MSVWRAMVLLCGELIGSEITVRDYRNSASNDEENYGVRVLAYSLS